MEELNNLDLYHDMMNHGGYINERLFNGRIPDHIPINKLYSITDIPDLRITRISVIIYPNGYKILYVKRIETILSCCINDGFWDIHTYKINLADPQAYQLFIKWLEDHLQLALAYYTNV